MNPKYPRAICESVPLCYPLCRHVVHDNKVTKHYGVNQFQSKRYPDEDATNPFEGQGGNNTERERNTFIT